jgi:exopolyphosphatase/pppGpp-phosphohydrolase
LGHRGKLKPEKLFQEFPYMQHRHIQLLALFRLATRFHRRRNPLAELLIPAQVDEEQIQLLLPVDFLEKNPLTHADLTTEVSELNKLGIKLSLDA